MTRRPLTDPDPAGWRSWSPLQRSVHVIVTLAYLMMSAWFAWLLVDEDGIPRAFATAALVACVIVVVDAGSRILGARRRA